MTLKIFVSDLNTWVQDLDEDSLRTMMSDKRRFVLSMDCLKHVSHQTMRDFIERFPYKYFDIEVNVPPRKIIDEI